MVRADPAQSDALMATTNATLMNMRGRDMPCWLRVSSDDLRTDQLAHWIEIGTGCARCRPCNRSPELSLPYSRPVRPP